MKKASTDTEKKDESLENPIIAVDYGFGFTKAYDQFGNKVKFPSLIRKHPVSIVEEQNYDVQEYCVSIDENMYRVGEFAAVGKFSRQWDRSQAIDDLNLKVFVGTALNLIVQMDESKYPEKDGAIHVNLSVGLPISFYQEQKGEVSKILKDMVVAVEVRKRKYTFKIDKLMISQQGVGAFFSFAYDINGQGKDLNSIANELKTYRVLKGNQPLDYNSLAKSIVNYGLAFFDIGYNTLDCFRIVNSKGQFYIIDESALSLEDKGIHNYHEVAYRNLINKRTDFDLDITQCEQALEDEIKNGVLMYGNEAIDLKPYFSNAYDQLADEFKNLINMKWGNNGLKGLGAALFCGGGSYKLNGLDFPIVSFVMRDAEYANALGFVIKMVITLNKMKSQN